MAHWHYPGELWRICCRQSTGTVAAKAHLPAPALCCRNTAANDTLATGESCARARACRTAYSERLRDAPDKSHVLALSPATRCLTNPIPRSLNQSHRGRRQDRMKTLDRITRSQIKFERGGQGRAGPSRHCAAQDHCRYTGRPGSAGQPETDCSGHRVGLSPPITAGTVAPSTGRGQPPPARLHRCRGVHAPGASLPPLCRTRVQPSASTGCSRAAGTTAGWPGTTTPRAGLGPLPSFPPWFPFHHLQTLHTETHHHHHPTHSFGQPPTPPMIKHCVQKPHRP